jgi:hypothetical protein
MSACDTKETDLAEHTIHHSDSQLFVTIAAVYHTTLVTSLATLVAHTSLCSLQLSTNQIYEQL